MLQPLEDIYPESEPSINEEVLADFEAKLPGHRILIIGERDYRVPAIIDLEVANMVVLGDPEEEARPPLEDTRGAKFVVAYKKNEIAGTDNILGVVRFTPYSPEVGVPTFHDLSLITEESEETIQHHFLEESGCEDISKILDVTTFAIDLDVQKDKKEHFKVANNLQYAITEYVLASYLRGEHTHSVSFIEIKAYEWLKDWGQPFVEFNGYTPMVYDTEHSGRGMIAQPAWLSLEKLYQLSEERKQRHLAKVAVTALIDVPMKNTAQVLKAIA